jgi:hypothetical protein
VFWALPNQRTNALGKYRLQEPSSNKLLAFVHGNRLVKVHLNSFEALANLWALPAAKNALRRTDKRVELGPFDANGTERLERLLLGDSFEQVVEQGPVKGMAQALAACQYDVKKECALRTTLLLRLISDIHE